MEYVFIFIAAVFVNNIVLAQFLGICPFLGSRYVRDDSGHHGNIYRTENRT